MPETQLDLPERLPRNSVHHKQHQQQIRVDTSRVSLFSQAQLKSSQVITIFQRVRASEPLIRASALTRRTVLPENFSPQLSSAQPPSKIGIDSLSRIFQFRFYINSLKYSALSEGTQNIAGKSRSKSETQHLKNKSSSQEETGRNIPLYYTTRLQQPNCKVCSRARKTQERR